MALSGILEGIPGYRGYIAAQDRRRSMEADDQAYEANNMKLAEMYKEQERKKKLQEILSQTGGDPVKASQAMLQAGFTDEAAKLNTLIQKPEKQPDYLQLVEAEKVYRAKGDTVTADRIVEHLTKLNTASGGNPYFNFLPTEEGYAVGDARTGVITPPDRVRGPNRPLRRATDSPSLQGEIAGAKEKGKIEGELSAQPLKDQAAALKLLETVGYDPVTGNDKVSELIEKSTSGLLQSGATAVARAANITTEGGKAINTLSAIANKMALDLLGGKLGAQISDADRQAILAQLGDIQNSNKTAGERLAAWKNVKTRMAGLGMLPQGQTQAPQPPKAKTPQDVQAIMWAKKNPNDPRAAAILKANGL